MKELSKGTGVQVRHIGEDAADQRVDNYLIRTLKGVPKNERDQLLYGNALRLYGLN